MEASEILQPDTGEVKLKIIGKSPWDRKRTVFKPEDRPEATHFPFYHLLSLCPDALSEVWVCGQMGRGPNMKDIRLAAH